MTAHTESVPVDGGRTPLEQLITTAQALIDEARAAIAEHQAPTVFTTLEHAVVDEPAAWLTPAEQDAMAMTAELWNLIVRDVVGNGASRDQDLAELAAPIHAIQHMVMAQAAARAYPDQYRLVGEVLVRDEVSRD